VITLPLVNAGVFNCTVNWGDGTPDSTVTAYNDPDRIHTYTLDGTYDVTITGECPSWAFSLAGDRLKIVAVVNWGDAGDFGGFGYLTEGFYGCSNLTSLGTGKIQAKAGLVSLYRAFRLCKFSTIPSGLLDNCVNLSVSSCSETFAENTSLTTVPTDLFRYCTLISSYGFRYTFLSCTQLATVPANLFKYNTLCDSFDFCFYGCNKLQFNANIFYANGEQGTRFLNKSVSFLDCFYRTSFTGVQGTAPDLWNCSFGTGQTSPERCFSGAGNSLTSLTDYASIPTYWGGPYTGLGYWTSKTDVIQGLINEGVLKVYHDHRSGTLYDYSGNNRTGSPNSANCFSKNGMITKGYVTVTNDATLQAATTGTLIIRQSLTIARSSPSFAYKNNQFRFMASIGLNRYELYCNGTTRSLAYGGLTGMQTHAVDFDNAGGTPVGYLNGILLGNYSGAQTVIADASNLLYGSASNDTEPQTVRYFLWISRKLTAAEHQEIYQQLQALS